MAPSDGEQNDLRNARRKLPQQALLPAWGVLFVAIVGAIYGWSQQAHPPAPPAPPVVETMGPDRSPNQNSTSDTSTADDGPRITPASQNPSTYPDANHSRNAKSNGRQSPDQNPNPTSTPHSRRTNRSPQTKPQPPPATADNTPHQRPATAPTHKTADGPAERSRATLISQVTLKNQDGRVIYQGPIDLQPTIDRISKGERNQHRNDGTVFQNREGRLARQPSGYYREYVVPTPNQSGPGPQRLIVGEEGEVFYSSDHYRTFRKLPVEIQTPNRQLEK